MKKLLYLLPLVGLMTMASCEEEERSSMPPIYEGFRLSPSQQAKCGDSLFVTCVQKVKGHYLNATDYEWNIRLRVEEGSTYKDSTLTVKYHTNYGGKDNSDPVGRFRIPTNTVPGNYSCTFRARFNNSADGRGGTYQAGTGEGLTGTITSYSYTIYSEAHGTCNLRVQ